MTKIIGYLEEKKQAGIERKKSKENKMPRYKSMVPCIKHGHVGDRFTSGGKCFQCHLMKDKTHKKEYDAKRNKDKCEEIRKKRIEYYNKNKEKIANYSKDWNRNNIERRRQISSNHKANKRLQSSVYVLSERMRARIRYAIINTGSTKKTSTEKILGCSFEELKRHIEKQFYDGMSWEKISNIHIDHIVPVSSGKTEEDVLMLCHFTNLRPLWAKDNMSKGNKMYFLI